MNFMLRLRAAHSSEFTPDFVRRLLQCCVVQFIVVIAVASIARGGSIDDVMIDVELSEPTVVNGDIVFAKITLYNSGDEVVDLEPFDPHRHIDVRTQDVIWIPHAIVGRKESRNEFEKGIGITRLEPKQSDCHVVMVRVLDLERDRHDRTIDLHFMVRIFECELVQTKKGFVPRDNLGNSSPPPRRFSRILGRIVKVPVVGQFLAPVAAKRLAEDKEFGWLFGQIHGGTNDWFQKYSGQKFDSFPGLLTQAVFPLPELNQWRIHRERDLNRDTVLYRMISLSIAYEVMHSRGMSPEKFFQTMTRFMQDSSPIEQWWLNEHMQVNLKERWKLELAELFAKENAKQSLYERKGYGSSKKGAGKKEAKPRDSFQANFQLADDRIIDGDVMLAEVTLHSRIDEEITFENRDIQDEIFVYFPAGKNVENPVVNSYRGDPGVDVCFFPGFRRLGDENRIRAMIRLNDMFLGEKYIENHHRFHLMEVAFNLIFSNVFGLREGKFTEATTVGEISGMGARVPVEWNLRSRNKKYPYDNEQRRIDENLFTTIHGGYKIGYGVQKQYLKMRKFSGLLDSYRFPFDSLNQWKMIRVYMRDGSTLARLIDVSVAFEELNLPRNDSISVFEGIVKLIENSSRIEKAWLFDSLYYQLCSTEGVSNEILLELDKLRSQYLQTLEQEEAAAKQQDE